MQCSAGAARLIKDFLTVLDLSEEVILGYDFLRENDAVLDFKRQLLPFGKDNRESVSWNTPRLGLGRHRHLLAGLRDPPQAPTSRI